MFKATLVALLAFIAAPALSAQASFPGCTAGIHFLFQVERPAALLPDSSGGLKPTAEPRDPHATLAQFVVDTAGRVIAESFHPIKFWGRAAADDARSASAHWHFTPAVAKGRSVCQLVTSTVDSVAAGA